MAKSNNRKTQYFGEYFEYQGEWLKIQSSEVLGVYKEILIKTIEQLDCSIKIHKRVLVLRVDLHLNIYTDDNKRISNFMNNLRGFLKRHYQIDKLGYVWVRELERAKTQHYHLALFLDGNKIQHPKKLNALIKEKWLPFGHCPVVNNPFYYIDKHNLTKQRQEAIYRISYLAKIRGKGYRDDQAKDYQTSRLKN